MEIVEKISEENANIVDYVTKGGLLQFINNNGIKVREMLPFLENSAVRIPLSYIDKFVPNVEQKLKTFGEELAKEQEKSVFATSGNNSAQGVINQRQEKRFLPLKKRSKYNV